MKRLHKNAELPAHFLNQVAGRSVRRMVWTAALISGLFFLAVLPYATTQFTRHPSFLPIYVTALIFSDLITAVMLYGQYYALRTRALLILAAGYLFTALATTGYAMVFPGLLTPTGLLGSGPQSTSIMYMFWHAGFPLMVLGYVWARRGPSATQALPVDGLPPTRARDPILVSIAIVLAAVIAGVVLATQGSELLPEFIEGDLTTPDGHRWLFCVWLLSVVALFALGRSGPHTALDLWIMVVMCVWVFDVALAAVFNSGRYDLGWYVGRGYGFVAACALLIVLLSEHARGYTRLVRLSDELRWANERLWDISMEDGLTQLANRRAFDHALQEQVAVSGRHGRSLALVLADVDHFKDYNDLYGHLAGDDCLKQVAAVLRESCRRPSDMAARHGGEEFALILPDTDRTGAFHVAESLRLGVLQRAIEHARSGVGPHVSVSVGVAVLGPGHVQTVQSLYIAADIALYHAKSRGRNQVACADAPTQRPRDEAPMDVSLQSSASLGNGLQAARPPKPAPFSST